MLHAAFAGCPGCSDARVMWDHATGRSRGFGFVSFRMRQEADAAIQVGSGACQHVSGGHLCVNGGRAGGMRGTVRRLAVRAPHALPLERSLQAPPTRAPPPPPPPPPPVDHARPVHRRAARALRLGAAQDGGHCSHGPAGEAAAPHARAGLDVWRRLLQGRLARRARARRFAQRGWHAAAAAGHGAAGGDAGLLCN